MDRAELHEGMTVYSADGERLGKVVSCDPMTFTVEKGIFFKKDFLARYEDIARIENDQAILRLGAQELDIARDQDRADVTYEQASAPPAAGGDADTAYERAAAPRSGMTAERSIPLAEEELVAEKRVERAGEVRVRKEVVTEEKQVTVPVMREEVHVERVAANREAGPDEATFTEDEIVVPVHEEEVEVRKRPVVREEVRVGTTTHVEQRAASGTVRREEVDIEDDTKRPRRRDDDEDPNTRR